MTAKRSAAAVGGRRIVEACLGGLLVAGTLFVFAQTREFSFVNYDDDFIWAAPEIRPGLTLEGIRWAFTTGRSGSWHPITWLSHMIDCQLFGPDNAGPQHVTSLAFHLASTLLLFVLLARMSDSLYASAGVAAVFAWHPLHVESVAWVFERKDVLCAFFWMVTMLVYVSQVRRPTRMKQWLWLPLAYALALLSKPMAVTLPFALLLIDYWPLARYAGLPDDGPARRRRARALVREKLPLFVLSAIFSGLTYFVQRAEGAMEAGGHLTFTSRLANAINSLGQYLVQAIWPSGLAMFYPHLGPSLTAVQVGGPLVLLAVVSVAAWHLRRRCPYLIVGWLWFLGTLVPVLGLVQVGEQARADRYTYLPLIGLAMMVFVGLRDGARALPRWRPLLAVAAALGLLALALVAHRQCSYWRDSQTLFAHALRVTRDNYLVHTNLGYVLSRNGDDRGALEHYLESYRIRPGAGVLRNIAAVLKRQGRNEEIRTLYRQALARHPSAEIHIDFGKFLAEGQDTAAALAQFEAALRLNPASVDAQRQLGALQMQQRRPAEAIPHLRAVVRARPGDAAAWSTLASAYLALGNIDEAERLCRHAVAIDRRRVSGYLDLAAILLGRGARNEAIDLLRQALDVDPGSIETLRVLGVAYATAGDLPRAEECFVQILRRNPQNPDANYNLATIRMRQGALDTAGELLRRALAARADFWEAQASLAPILLSQGKAAEAATLYRAAINAQPKNAQLRYGLAAALIKMHDNNAAVDQLQQSLAIDPKFEEARRLLQSIQHRAGTVHSP
jgi:tetratricopeptide (TPR) repeat protein